MSQYSSRLAAEVSKLGSHRHLCMIYERRQERIEALVPFFQLGLSRGELCIYIAPSHHAAEVMEALSDFGIQEALKTGQLKIVDTPTSLLGKQKFQPDKMTATWQQLTDQAVAQGFPAVRVAVDMAWTLSEKIDLEKLIEYESKANDIFDKHQLTTICQYDATKFDPEVIKGALLTHPEIIYAGLLARNFYYVPPAEFMSQNRAAVEVGRWLGNILTYEQHENTLEESREQLAEANRRITRLLERAL
jgi:hypothetical protein